MKKSFLHILQVLLLAVCLAAPAKAVGGTPGPVWETVATTDTANNRDEIEQRDNIDIVNRDGIIYITVEQPVKVEIYSILGQLITSRTLKPGTVRLTIRQRGVYILKAGSITRRINL